MKKLTNFSSGLARLALIPLFCFVLNLMSMHAQAKAPTVTVNANNARLVSVMKQIEEQTGMTFFYENSKVNTARRVSVNAEEESLSSVLDRLFSGSNVDCKVMDDKIVLTPLQTRVATASSQGPRRLSGTVTDSNGEPLPGAAVVIAGTNKGVVTDNNGHYSIEVPSGTAVEVSCIGFVTQTLNPASDVLNVTLATDVLRLDEAVAIGYATVKKRDLTGAVASVASDDIVRLVPTQTLDAIKGQVAGVNILADQGGKPGAPFTTVIRGNSSFNRSNAPLVVVDGAIGGDINLINPADIDKVDILKDAASCAIYGSKGANGVILVTTKRGHTGRAKVSYSGNAGIVKAVNQPEFMSAEQYNDYIDMTVGYGYWGDPRTDEEFENIKMGRYYDWIKGITHTGFKTNHTVSLAGGTENVNYHFSAGYERTQGVVRPEDYNRFNFNGSIDARISDKLSAGFTANYAYAIRNVGSPEIMRSAVRRRWSTWPWDDEGNLVYFPSNTGDFSPLIEERNGNYEEEVRTQDFVGNLYLEWRPVKGLTARSAVSAHASESRDGFSVGYYSKSAGMNPADVLARYNPQQTVLWTWDNTLTYNWEKADHKVNASLMNSLSGSRFENFFFSASNWTENTKWYQFESAGRVGESDGDGMPYSDYSAWQLASFMGRVNYAYKDRYLLTLSGRYDGSSKLAAGHKWHFFPSAAVAWRASEEPFIKDWNVFSNLKFRLSYGTVGNDSVAPYQTSALVGVSSYYIGSGLSGYAPSNLSNESLTWEITKEANLGIEMGFLNDRISLAADLYDRQTSGLIMGMSIPNDIGFSTTTGNYAKTQNRGIELTLNTINISNKDFTWKTNINFSRNRDKVKSLAFGVPLMYGSSMTAVYGAGMSSSSIQQAYIVGEPVTAVYYYKFDGIWQTGEESQLCKDQYGSMSRPGWVKVKDVSGPDGVPDGHITEDDKTVLGTYAPDWTGGMTNTFYWKNLDFSFFLYHVHNVAGFDSCLQDFGRGDHQDNKRYAWLDYWTPDNPSNTWYYPDCNRRNTYVNSIYIENVSWTRLQNVTLGYTLPDKVAKKIGMSRARVYLSANNPFVWSKYKHKGWDPEWQFYSAVGLTFSTATYLFGLDVSF